MANEEPNILFYLGAGVTNEGAILLSFFGNGHQCADRALTHDGAEYGVSLLQDQKWHVLTKTRGHRRIQSVDSSLTVWMRRRHSRQCVRQFLNVYI